MENDDAVAGEGYVEETAARRKGDRGLRGKRESVPKKREGGERRRRAGAGSFGGGEVI